MKKNILLILLSAGLLAGCSLSDIISFGKKDNSSSDNETTDNNQQTGNNNNNNNTNKNTKTLTVNFFGSNLSSDWTAPGVKMDCTLLSSNSQNEKLVNCTFAQVNDTSLLSELFFTELNTAFYETSGLVIQVGNGSGDDFKSGTLTWTSTKKIVTVDVVGQCYSKVNGATDSSAHMTIEAGGKGTDVTENNNYQRPITNSTTKDMSFVVGSGDTPSYKTYPNEYPEGINRFRLTSLDGRMLLKSLTITWEL